MAATRRRTARPFHELPAAVHQDAYVLFLPATALTQLRGLCANAATAATTHLRDEAVRRIAARSAALPADRVPALTAVRDTSPRATADEAVVAALDPELHLPINVEHVLAAAGRHTPVVVWPYHSAMAGAVRRALEYEAGRSAGPASGSWALVPPPLGVDESAATAGGRLERVLHGYGVVAVRVDARKGGDEMQSLGVVEVARYASTRDDGIRSHSLRHLLASWYDEASNVFKIPGPSAGDHGGVRILAVESPSGCDECDTVFFTDLPVRFSVRHVVGTARDGTRHFCSTNRGSLVTVDLSACVSLSSIDGHSFRSCAYLERVLLPPGLEELGGGALGYCSNLLAMDLSGCASLRIVDKDTFSFCSALRTVVWPSGLEQIGSGVLFHCRELVVVDFRACQRLEKIGSSALARCSMLVSVDLSPCSSLRVLGKYAFRECQVLERLVWPPNIEEIGDQVLYNCPKLSTVDLSACALLRTIGDETFRHCRALSSVLWPLRLESLGEHVLADCPKLATVDLSACSSLRSIGNAAFESCARLNTVVWPAGLAKLGDFVLFNCRELATVEFGECRSLEQVGEHVLFECPKLVTVDLRAYTSLRSIGGNAFGSCAALESVLLPPGFPSPDSSAAYKYCAGA